VCVTALRLREPSAAPLAVLVDSPHSGFEMPADFGTAAPPEALRTTWDAFVDELWGDAPALGASLVAATFPRAYIDVNRAEHDIDESLLVEPWPTPVTPSDYTRRGMGLIRREALPGVPLYTRALTVAEVQGRITNYYRPYRAAVATQLESLRRIHGVVFYLDAHSMKSRGNAMNVDAGALRPDVVVSDRHGRTAGAQHTAFVAECFRAQGYTVQLNDPYQGGDLVRSFGAPANGVHAIQVEVNRALYMNESEFTRGAGFARLQAACASCVRALGEYARRQA
jgi:N-formylglutamate deformylase